MEQFLLENADRYRKLVGDFTPPAARKSTRHDRVETATANPDIIVSARIRPMLDEELSQGFPEGVIPRRGTPGTVDLHEIRRPVRGPPGINVRLPSYPT